MNPGDIEEYKMKIKSEITDYIKDEYKISGSPYDNIIFDYVGNIVAFPFDRLVKNNTMQNTMYKKYTEILEDNDIILEDHFYITGSVILSMYNPKIKNNDIDVFIFNKDYVCEPDIFGNAAHNRNYVGNYMLGCYYVNGINYIHVDHTQFKNFEHFLETTFDFKFLMNYIYKNKLVMLNYYNFITKYSKYILVERDVDRPNAYNRVKKYLDRGYKITNVVDINGVNYLIDIVRNKEFIKEYYDFINNNKNRLLRDRENIKYIMIAYDGCGGARYIFKLLNYSFNIHGTGYFNDNKFAAYYKYMHAVLLINNSTLAAMLDFVNSLYNHLF